jgi:hypothetical protein
MPLLDRQAFADPTLPVPSWRNIKGAVRGLMGMATPPDPYEEAGKMVQQGRAGDYLGALETGFGAMPTTGAIKAYHGSPHSFDKFSLDKIGTGEGAQVYGHGLYFAEAEPTAKYYRDALALKNDPREGINNLLENVGFGASKGDIDKHVGALGVRGFTEDQTNDLYAALKNRNSDGTLSDAGLAALQRLDRSLPQPGGGHMYEVNINAEPEHFLDWDKPFSQQSEHVQKALRSMPFQEHRFQKDMLGREQMGKDFAPDNDLFLGGYTQAGIPGIKYLDQGSRGAGEGSRNYVVFDDKLVDIARKYGLLPLGMGGFDFGQQEQK